MHSLLNGTRERLRTLAEAYERWAWPLAALLAGFGIFEACLIERAVGSPLSLVAHLVTLGSIATVAWIVCGYLFGVVRRRTDELRASQRRLMEIIASAMDAIITIDEDYRIVIFNTAAETVFRCAAADAIGSSLDRFIPDRFRVAHREQVQVFGRSGVTRRLVGVGGGVTALRAGVEEFPAEASISQSAAGDRKLYTVILRDVTEQKRAEAELESSRAKLRALAARLESIREEERTRLAREVHDQLGLALTSLRFDLSWLSRQIRPEETAQRDKVLEMTASVDETIRQVRQMATTLRPTLLDDAGLVAAIEWQAHDFERRTGITCRVVSDLDDHAIDKDLATAVFRIFQEALTNIARHAGATSVEVWLPRPAGQVTVSIEDNGRGITRDEIEDIQSIGLLGMRERAMRLGGDVTFASGLEAGTRVTIVVPLRDGQSPGTEPEDEG
jgi:PAS domain S-box-containing protein